MQEGQDISSILGVLRVSQHPTEDNVQCMLTCGDIIIISFINITETYVLKKKDISTLQLKHKTILIRHSTRSLPVVFDMAIYI